MDDAVKFAVAAPYPDPATPQPEVRTGPSAAMVRRTLWATVVILGVAAIVHIARCFVENNPGVPEDDVIAEIQRGIEAGIAQRPLATPMSAH